MAKRSGIFDMIGPVMIGPSSSHTAGVVRIGRVAKRIFGKHLAIESVQITFYNSFARTYEGHGSDRAILAGLLDFKTDDARIKNALDLATQESISYTFKAVGNASIYHPNTVKVEVQGNGRSVEVIGESLGGGVINIASLDDFKADFSASNHTLIIKATDERGVIAFISNILAQENCNIATMSVSRKGKNDLACHVIEMDSGIPQITMDYIRHINWCKELIYIPDIDF
ncbi:MAG: L-serine ammonia-lyase, iron-sulfur-dependent subunit beta [Cyclobacteriaceae bacterium]|nr:L-serine ammonia-lyase, iron-sulfur-dependent subunit beta [Cyclobacteriaceae bacterium]